MDRHRVVIVDQHNYHGFSPLLCQVATAGLEHEHIAQNVRGIFQRSANVDVRQSRVTGVDFETRRLLVEDGPPLPCDSPIISAGEVSSDFGIPGVAEHAIPLKTASSWWATSPRQPTAGASSSPSSRPSRCGVRAMRRVRSCTTPRARNVGVSATSTRA